MQGLPSRASVLLNFQINTAETSTVNSTPVETGCRFLKNRISHPTRCSPASKSHVFEAHQHH
jgi:hypothetical protein